ncbi:hypothetical protein ASG57_33635 [Bradyrhizobium sp. Leaf396]|nr:hypothetical protein ASG57_33635 [Bradyrhizobium sp. Leaf396]
MSDLDTSAPISELIVRAFINSWNDPIDFRRRPDGVSISSACLIHFRASMRLPCLGYAYSLLSDEKFPGSGLESLLFSAGGSS